MNVSCPECRTVFRLDPAKITSVSMRARCSVCGGLIPVGAAVSWGDDLPTVPAPATVGAGSSPNVKSIGSRPKTPLQSAATAWPPPVPRNPLASPTPAASSKTATPNQPAAAPPPQPPVQRRTPPFSPKFTPTLQREQPAPDEKRSAKTPGHAPRATEETPSALGATFGAPLTPPSRTSIPEPAASPPPPSAPRSATPSSLNTGGSVSAAFSTPSTPASGPAAVQRKPINPFLANDPNQKARRLARALVSDMVAYHPTKRDEGIQAGTLKHLFREEIKKSYEEYVEQVGRDFAESTMHFQEALNDVLAGGRKIF